ASQGGGRQGARRPAGKDSREDQAARFQDPGAPAEGAGQTPSSRTPGASQGATASKQGYVEAQYLKHGEFQRRGPSNREAAGKEFMDILRGSRGDGGGSDVRKGGGKEI